MKIVFFEMEPWEHSAFQPLDNDHNVVYEQLALSANNASSYADADIISTFIYSQLNAEVLSKFKHLKLIATRSTGYDHIDLNTCRQRKTAVANVPSYGENTVAEHVFALLLCVSHRILEATERTRHGNFSAHGLDGFDLRGKTLGVIGVGSIGRHVIRMARGFEMKVLGHDVTPKPELTKKLDFVYTELDTLLKQSDIITLHVPGGPQNRHLLSEREFGLMKPGVVIINTARGDLIDVRALLKGLVSGAVRGAGLDVLPEEPLIREEAELLRSGFVHKNDLETLLTNHVLLNMPNVVITPHSAFNTKEAVQRILATTAENVTAFIDGHAKNKV